jgi:hypothetical protein
MQLLHRCSCAWRNGLGYQHGRGLFGIGDGHLYQRKRVAVGHELHVDDQRLRSGFADCGQLHLRLWGAHAWRDWRCYEHLLGFFRLGDSHLYQRKRVAVGHKLQLDD